MKKSLHRSLALFLCLVLLLSALAGCAAQDAKAEVGSKLSSEESALHPQPGSEDGAAEETQTPVSVEEAAAETLSYDMNTSYGMDGESEASVKYDESVAYSIEYEGESVQAQPPATPEAALGEALSSALIEGDGETVFPWQAEPGAEGMQYGEFAQGQTPEEGSSLLQEALGTLPGNENATLGESGSASLASGAAPRQLTIEDIQAMNPNSVVIDIYTNDGYLSTLVGKYYDKKVTNVEEGVLSIQGMASLLGLGKGCDFFAVYSETNEKGYTFYTYQQRYGGYTLRYATLRIVVDPEGYTAGLSCSFVPNVGTASQEPSITKEQAEQLVAEKFERFHLTLYTEHTVRLAATFGYQVYNCYVVYTNNPDATASFDMPYIEHYISTDGSYITLVPANDFASSNLDANDPSSYFTGMQVLNYSTSVYLADGTTRSVSVPVCYNSRDRKYYLMDPSRKIAVGEYYDLNYRNTVSFVTSDTIDGWSDNNLMAYANYIIVYDFYADHGLRSIDGFETPILITVGWCESDGTPVDNACFYGIKQGWACFGVSDINHASDCVDVVGHEYTHGVTNQSMQGCVYRNETGAINEAYSDIMGNLAEMSLGYTDDSLWLVGEHSGKTSRNMSDPNSYSQPAFVGDVYYIPAVLNPDFGVNDYGGVHINNSLLGHIAYRMAQTGMSYEQQISMWLTSIELITPKSDYEDLHGALLFALKINGLLSSYGSELNAAFADAGLNDDWSKTYLNASKSGCGRVLLQTRQEIANATVKVFFQSTDGSKTTYIAVPDANGIVSMLVPAGNYISQISIFNGNERTDFNYTGSGWSKGGKFRAFSVQEGKITELAGSSVGSTGSSAEELQLISFDGGYFSMTIPDGWRIEVNGEYASFSIKIFDPNDPSTQLFLYGGLAPFHKSESSRSYWSKINAMIGNGPVLSSENIIGILDAWDYSIEYQLYYENKQYFTSLYDINVLGGAYYEGFLANVNGIESGCFATCSTNWDDDCYLTVLGGLVDTDTYRVYGGNMFYVCRGLAGILAPADRYDEVFDNLVKCLQSLQFTQSYINASQSSSDPMTTRQEIAHNMAFAGEILTAIYENYGP